ncbi:2-hydroxy-3-oxopropionate reductase [Microbacterium sp. MAHUQ-60]|uniref:2-hydroxy-3-oxopropionate reductase n=1 Tax=unclassified Microbacterium TaxID=2609290 RepID=UPI0036151D83
MKVGFIGLGVMGRPMVARLIDAGHELFVSRVKAVSEFLVEAGATGCASPGDVARAADVVIVMVPRTEDVEQVLFGANGVAEGLRPGALVIDMSSISPVATRVFAQRVQDLGASYLDAPVSGGDVGAKAGTLSIMVGGEASDFERARPLFEILGANITLVGAVGAGQTTKVANQIIVAGTIQAVAEALRLAEAAGADTTKVRAAISGGFASSRVLEAHGQRMIDEAFDPGFRIRLHHKDLDIALSAAESLGVELPVTSRVEQLMAAAMQAGMGDLDHSALFVLLRDPDESGR